MLEEILANEEEHADDLADFLFTIEPQTGETASHLYSKDEVPKVTGAGQAAAPTQPETRQQRAAKQ